MIFSPILFSTYCITKKIYNLEINNTYQYKNVEVLRTNVEIVNLIQIFRENYEMDKLKYSHNSEQHKYYILFMLCFYFNKTHLQDQNLNKNRQWNSHIYSRNFCSLMNLVAKQQVT